VLASSMAADRVILMHQGGWDELLIALGPLVVIAVLVIAARRNVPTEPEDQDQDAEDR
jgi:hypothetical protein